MLEKHISDNKLPKKQQEQITKLQRQVEQLTEVMKCLVTYHTFDSDFTRPERKPISLLTHSVMKKSVIAQDFLLQHNSIEGKVGMFYDSTSGRRSNRPVAGEGWGVVATSTLHYACANNDMELVDKLLKHGAKINLRSLIQPVGDLRSFSHDRKMGFKGNNLQGEDYVYCTPLQIACAIGSFELVKILVENGATTGTKHPLSGMSENKVLTGGEGDLIAGYLQTRGSPPIHRFILRRETK